MSIGPLNNQSNPFESPATTNIAQRQDEELSEEEILRELNASASLVDNVAGKSLCSLEVDLSDLSSDLFQSELSTNPDEENKLQFVNLADMAEKARKANFKASEVNLVDSVLSSTAPQDAQLLRANPFTKRLEITNHREAAEVDHANHVWYDSHRDIVHASTEEMQRQFKEGEWMREQIDGPDKPVERVSRNVATPQEFRRFANVYFVFKENNKYGQKADHSAQQVVLTQDEVKSDHDNKATLEAFQEFRERASKKLKYLSQTLDANADKTRLLLHAKHKDQSVHDQKLATARKEKQRLVKTSQITLNKTADQAKNENAESDAKQVTLPSPVTNEHTITQITMNKNNKVLFLRTQQFVLSKSVIEAPPKAKSNPYEFNHQHLFRKLNNSKK
jgi:hypothetical protein